ncbi:hypothetical protein RB599_010060 [Gaeumannomyces hyphopodioides]
MAHDEDTLVLGSRELKIGARSCDWSEELLVRDTGPTQKKNKSGRSCGIGSGRSAGGAAAAAVPSSIPLYNILWAEVAGDSLTVDYAQDLSKARLRAAKLSIPLLPATSAGAPPNAANPDGAATAKTPSPTEAASAWAARLLDRSYDPAATRRKRAYVLVNPHAGPGGAMRKFENEVRPIFAAARMEMTVVTTGRRGEAEELVKAVDVDAYDVVAAASGDGLVYEVFNGLGRRPDARRALGSLAVVHIPCGSANAMACNLYGTHRPAAAALAAVKGVPTPMDLVSVTQGGTRTLSFLSQALGVIAEADLGTEDLRWVGSARFTYGFLARCFKRAVYPCEISVKVEIEDKAEIKQHYSRHHANSSAEALSGGGGDGGGGSGKGESGSSSADDSVANTREGLPSLKYGTINDKVPEGWETFTSDKLGNFYCGNQHVLGRLHRRRAYGPRHGQRRHLALQGHLAHDVGRERALLRQPSRQLPQGLGLSHHAPEPGGRLHQHRRRARAVRALPVRDPPRPRARHLAPRAVRGPGPPGLGQGHGP